MNCAAVLESDQSEFVELDPTGRYGRYNEILGKGSSKTVYRAFDEYDGIEVAWNQVKLYDFLRSPEDLERLYCEIHLLKTLKHRNIMKFCTSWVDTTGRNINFVTEMFTSGTLRQYRLKHKRVNIRAVKHWCRQILSGLLYLHSHDPPIIHRDLKCDNIFINGNQGEVKIGDLGLAAILRKSHAARCVGTPEFMAPEVYEEEYNELVDIYAFGMCILEMVTFDYPYSECTHPAQIYKKVISGKKPDALYKVKDFEVRQFVEKCLATASQRLSARELLKDPFLQNDDDMFGMEIIDYHQYFGELGPTLRQPLLKMEHSNGSLINGYSNYLGYESWYDNPSDFEPSEIDLLSSQEDGLIENVDIAIKGRREDDGIFLRLRMADKEGRIRNIYFPFNIETDTALSVATEMVAELDITDQDVTKIADMIDGEIASLVPGWKKGSFKMEESPPCIDGKYCLNCHSSGDLMDYVSCCSPGVKSLQVLPCSETGCTAVHGRFEEITYQFEGSEQCLTEGAPACSSQSDGVQCTDIWEQHDCGELTSHGSSNGPSHHNEDEAFCAQTSGKVEKVAALNEEDRSEVRNSLPEHYSSAHNVAEDLENEIRQEMRWLKAKYQMQLRELKDQQLKAALKPISSLDTGEQKKDHLLSTSNSWIEEKEKHFQESISSEKEFTSYFPINAEKESTNNIIRNYEKAYGSCSPSHLVTTKSFYTGALLPQTLHRATSLPVDAVDF